MLVIMLRKIRNKKWMNLSLLLGCILLVATAVSFPLYEAAAYDRMLRDEFEHYKAIEGKWPAEFDLMISSKKEKGGKTIKKIEELIPNLYSDIGLTEHDTIKYYTLVRAEVASELMRNDAAELNARLGTKTDLASHINILDGSMYSDSGINADGAIEVVVSEQCLSSQGYLLGETFKYKALRDPDGNPLRFCICGVYEPVRGDDFYWNEKDGEFDDMGLMAPALFDSLFTGENAGRYNLLCYYTARFEYEDLGYRDVDGLIEKTEYYVNESPYRTVIDEPGYFAVLADYKAKQARINATLAILQFPVLIMLAAFLLMISSQMYEMERNEISVIKSRGSSGFQIFMLYLYQALTLVITGALFGIPLGMLFASLLGSTRNFLVFDLSEAMSISFNSSAAIYAGGAMFAALLCLTLPAIKHSRVSIVGLKQQRVARKKPLWERLYLDFIIMAVAFYAYYSFSKSSSEMAESVLNRKALDPLLYLSSSLMIIGLGLLFLRLQPLFLKVIYWIGKRFWHPAPYIAFMENIKNGRKQQLIMLFLLMTVSLGMYHSTVARTIVENAVRNTDYADGCDLLFREVWQETVDTNGARTGIYVEPDVTKYMDAPFAESFTRVYNLTDVEADAGKAGKLPVNLMGIHTKEYGSLTWVDTELNGQQYYKLLNELAVVEDGLLVSANFRDKQGLKTGDSITCKNANGKSFSGVILDFFDYWPGYASRVNVQQADGSIAVEDSYLVVTHFSLLKEKLGDEPYEIMVKMKPDAKESDVNAWLTDNKVRLTRYVNRNIDLENAQTDPLLQGTNGVLTMGFVVTLILCAVGYLIYWIMSLKERELVFGVLRASGMHTAELFFMLFLEQLFCGVLSIVAGLGIGKLTSELFVPILQQVYASSIQLLPMVLITRAEDLWRLVAVIAAVLIACLAVLSVLLLKMNVAKALKLGEE